MMIVHQKEFSQPNLSGRNSKYPFRSKQTQRITKALVQTRATTFHDFSGKTLGGGSRDNPTEGTVIHFSQFKGKVVLVNNVATM